MDSVSFNVKVCDNCHERRNTHSIYQTPDGRKVCYACLPGPAEETWVYTWLGYSNADEIPLPLRGPE